MAEDKVDKAEDKVDKAITDFFAALKELGELRHRYDNVIGNVNETVYHFFSPVLSASRSRYR